MTLTLTYHGETTIPLEVEGITPDRLKEMSTSQIERLPVYHGNRNVVLGEFFGVDGDASDQHLIWQGDLSGVHWLGAKMTSGRMDISGNVGRHLGSEMKAGEIHLQGDAGDWAGAEMRGGLLQIRGNAGDGVGGAYQGSPRGMRGGTLLVHGDAGHELGAKMRRGLVAVAGNCGGMPGVNMLAGTILVFGNSGNHPGAGMKRGTIGLFGDTPPKMLPSFREGCRFQPPMMRLICGELRRREFPHDETLANDTLRIVHGDLLALGRGEILLRAS